jgi:glutaredoxin
MAHTHIVNVQIQLMKEGNTIIVYCPALDLCGYGKTADEAKKDFDVAFKIFVKETTEHGTLEKALEELGWKKIEVQNQSRWQPQIVLLGESIQEIPLAVPA